MYQACVLSTLLYGSETWTTYASQEKRLNCFHLRCLRRLLQVRWQDRVTNSEVLQRANIPSLFALLGQKRLKWLGHVRRMEDGRIPKDLLYGELREGSRPVGRPHLRFRDVCKRDMKAADIDSDDWERMAEDRHLWRVEVNEGMKRAETTRCEQHAARRERRKARAASVAVSSPFVCYNCTRDCLSRIGLYSHSRRCQSLS